MEAREHPLRQVVSAPDIPSSPSCPARPGLSRPEGTLRIRLAAAADLPALRPVFEAAKGIMRADGNTEQWSAPGFPPEELILHDIERGGGFVIESSDRFLDFARNDRLLVISSEAEGDRSVIPSDRSVIPSGAKESVVGYFALLPSPEPTYNVIDGAWLTDAPYGVIHRMASYPDVHGIFATIMDFAAARHAHLRIDTHRDNRIMRHLIEKHGFTYCGVIWLPDGTERLAYER